MDKKIIVSIELEYVVSATTDIEDFLCEINLPDNYIENSLDIVSINDAD